MQLFKTNTPNTLTVQIPYAPVQSLPNLGPPTSPQTPNHPGGVLDHTPGGQQQHQPSGGGRASSPGIPPRGISYPPVSPKSSLRRQKVLQASQSNSNGQTPPLIKSRTVTTDGITIPVITGVPCSNIDDEMEESHNLEEKSIELEKCETAFRAEVKTAAGLTANSVLSPSKTVSEITCSTSVSSSKISGKMGLVRYRSLRDHNGRYYLVVKIH